MKNEEHTTSKRYYIFRHDPKKPDQETVQYRDSTGSWYANFDKANLWSDYEFVVKKAKELKARQIGTGAAGYNVCIGQVTVTVSGMFNIVVV